MISQSERRAGTVRQAGPQRPSWCYGTPGLARAQQLAALAVDDPQRQRRAEEALAGCVADEQLSLLGDASLCHGWAGLVLSTWRAAADAGNGGKLADLLPRLRAGWNNTCVITGHRPATACWRGTAGVRLTQHTTAVNAPPPSGWDACLLLNG